MHTISAYNQTRHLGTFSLLHPQAQGLGSRCGEHYADRICNMLCSCRVLIHVLAVSLGVGDDVARGARSCLGCWTVHRPHPRHPWPRIANRETGKTHRMPRRAAAPDAHIACVPKSKSNANPDEDEGEDEDEDNKRPVSRLCTYYVRIPRRTALHQYRVHSRMSQTSTLMVSTSALRARYRVTHSHNRRSTT